MTDHAPSRTNHARTPVLLAVLLAACAASCVDVAADRALRDLTVGQAALGDTHVSVHEGLAAVRRLAPGELWLWAGAPRLLIHVDVGPASGGPWDITIENILSDAELTAETTTGERLAVTLVDEPRSTRRSWRVNLPPGSKVALALRSPDADRLDRWRFAVFADVQEAIDGVREIYTKMNAVEGIRFALISGDLTQRGSAEELERFQREMAVLRFPCFATLGNHELGTRDDLFHDYFGRGNYRFSFRGVQFTLLDSASATIAPLAYDWLDGWLADGRGALHVVTMHIPPLDPVGARNGAFASRGEANKLLSLLAQGGVDLTFYGHIHSYYAFENAGIPAHITGGGGAIPERLDGIGRHFLTVDVSPTEPSTHVAVVRVD